MDNELVVYWSPSNNNDDINWNILYEDPKNLYESLIKDSDRSNISDSFFLCPSFKNLTKNTFYIKNPILSGFTIQNNDIVVNTKTFIRSEVSHRPSIKNNLLLDYGISHYFFSEEEVEAIRTPPYFHNAQHLRYGAVVPGKWNCGLWFRPIRTEFNLWNGVNEMSIQENEPISYITFLTSKKVVLKRFMINKDLSNIALACSISSQWEPKVSLLKRYNRFKNSKTKNIVLQNIKNNLVEN